jgi:hypothetical protein
MSIWGSFCSFGSGRGEEPPPYADFTDATGHYTTDDPASLGSTPRGGFFDVARSGMCDLIRFSITEDEPEHLNAQVWLDRRQATHLRDQLTEMLAQEMPGSRLAVRGGS